MCDLNGWDGAIQISKRALSDLAIALDQITQPLIPTALPQSCVTNGLTINCTEQLLNFELLVPRVLYATQNATFDPFTNYPGADDSLEQLHARLQEYVRLTGINPLTGQVTGDPGNRLTFVRNRWFDNVTEVPDIELQPAGVLPNTVRLRFGGKVFIGANFVDGNTAATNASSRDFTMELDYEVRVSSGKFFPLDQLNVGLGSLPFSALAPPAGCPLPAGAVGLPPAGQPVWAQNLGTPSAAGGVRWALTNAGNIAAGTATLFTGAPGDAILDGAGERWVVRDISREGSLAVPLPATAAADQAVDLADGLLSIPRRLLIDTGCPPNNPPVAEAGQTFAALVFTRVNALDIPGLALNAAQRAAVDRSIMKLDGFLVGAWLTPLLAGAAGLPPPNPQQLALLALLGRQGMSFAPLPGALTPPIAPQLITPGGGAPPFVQSDVIVFEDAATAVFGGASGDTIALGGRFIDLPAPPGPLLRTFNLGQDLAVAISQNVVDRWLVPQIKPGLNTQLNRSVPRFRNGAFMRDPDSLRFTLANDRINVHVEGSGATRAGVIVRFDFTVDFPLRLTTRPAVLRAANGLPVDAVGTPFPAVDPAAATLVPAALPCFGLDVANGDLLASNAAVNPLCFLGYIDVRAGGNPITQLPRGPWTLITPATGCPPPGTTTSPTVAPAFQWRELQFLVPPFNLCSRGDGFCWGALRPGLEIAFVPPREDQIDVDVEFGWLVEVLVGLIGGLFLGIDPIVGAQAADPLADLLLGKFVVAPAVRSGVAGVTPVSVNNATGWQVFLQHSNPLGPSNDAVTIDEGGVCLLFRVLPGPDPGLGVLAQTVCGVC